MRDVNPWPPLTPEQAPAQPQPDVMCRARCAFVMNGVRIRPGQPLRLDTATLTRLFALGLVSICE